jgi:endonuclease/exonuclease/phosphatase family metal-dependent hydrolase
MGTKDEVSQLIVATYNVHRCIGSDAMYRPGRIVEVLRELNADVIALQEVDGHIIHEEGHQLNYIVKRTGYNVAVGSTMIREDAEYGNAILSRFPILKTRNIDLSVKNFEPRGALEIQVEHGGVRFRIINTHLGLRYGERRKQIKKLMKVINEDRELPLILMGDFNEWLPLVGSTLKLAGLFAHTRNLKTFPSKLPTLGLDKIFVETAELLVKTEVHRSPMSKKASDHLPVKAYLQI